MATRIRNVNRRSQNIGLIVGAIAGGLVLLFFFLPGQEQMSAAGPMNTGHEELACEACHVPAKGTIAQQIQANAQFYVGLRSSPVPFGHYAVDNGVCQDCHENPLDRHPVHRFNEPRFQDARAAIEPQNCESCHREHSGIRVTIGNSFCQTCHVDTVLDNDPVTPTHELLIETGNWASCLQCHDFHGNHDQDPETDLSQAIPLEKIDAYFAGGPSPYGDTKHFEAKRP